MVRFRTARLRVSQHPQFEDVPGPISAPGLYRQRLEEISVCVIAALAYVSTLSYGFVYDDALLILKNPALRDWHYLPKYFNSHLLGAVYPSAGGNYYRPFVLLWLRLNYITFGVNPIGWHATTVLCHVVATYLVFNLAKKITGQQKVSFIAALLFAVHPVHIESVAWISGVSDSLMSCFFLGSLLAFFKWRESRKNIFLSVSLVLCAGALLSKETAVVLPMVVFRLRYSGRRKAPSLRGNSRWTSSSRPSVFLSLTSSFRLPICG